MNYSVGINMSRENIENRIRDINGKVEDVRYICLIKKIQVMTIVIIYPILIAIQ